MCNPIVWALIFEKTAGNVPQRSTRQTNLSVTHRHLRGAQETIVNRREYRYLTWRDCQTVCGRFSDSTPFRYTANPLTLSGMRLFTSRTKHLRRNVLTWFMVWSVLTLTVIKPTLVRHYRLWRKEPANIADPPKATNPTLLSTRTYRNQGTPSTSRIAI